MNNLENIMTVAIGILLLLIVVQWVVIVNQKKEKDNLVKWLDWYRDKWSSAHKELEEYRIREETPIPFVPNIDYLMLKKEVKRYKPPYEVGQKVMYNDEGSVKVGYINRVRSMHYGTDKKEVVIERSYGIGSKFYNDIIDVVKEDKEKEK